MDSAIKVPDVTQGFVIVTFTGIMAAKVLLTIFLFQIDVTNAQTSQGTTTVTYSFYMITIDRPTDKHVAQVGARRWTSAANCR